MSFFGNLLSDFTNLIFGGSGGNHAAVPQSASVLPPPTVPVMPVFNPAFSQNNGQIDAAKSDAAFQIFWAAASNSLVGKTSATLDGFSSEDHTLQFGHLRDVVSLNPDGSSSFGQQFVAFGGLDEHSVLSTHHDTFGGVSFGGSSTLTGYYNPFGYNPTEKVVVMEDYTSSHHNQLTLIGVDYYTPDYSIGLKG